MSLLTEEEKKRILDIINEKFKFHMNGTIEDRPKYDIGKCDGEDVLYIPLTPNQITLILYCMSKTDIEMAETPIYKRLKLVRDDYIDQLLKE